MRLSAVGDECGGNRRNAQGAEPPPCLRGAWVDRVSGLTDRDDLTLPTKALGT
jgi:hypothetical protein